METRAFEELVARLTREGPPRVWSLIVTLFGDLALDEGAELSGTLLTRLGALVDIRAEAMRVALHRLKRDGWIDSRRSGREGAYFLTDTGRAQSLAASPRIYGSVPPLPDAWHIVIAGSGASQGEKVLDDLLLSGDYVALGPLAALGPGPLPRDIPDLIAVAFDEIAAPAWLGSLVVPPDVTETVDALLETTAILDRVLGREDTPSVLESATIRMLLVHAWRRVALRVPVAPHDVFPPDWRGNAARAAILGLLARLPRPSLSDLEAAARAT